MIERLIITNFRGVKEGRLNLHPITILLGSNNAAKSTILEALFLGPNPCRDVPYIIPNSQFFPSCALEVISALHKTLDYRGYAFLLRNYTSKTARIETDLRYGRRRALRKYWIDFLLADGWIVLKSSDPSANTIAERIGAVETQYFAKVAMNSTQITRDKSVSMTENALLLSPKLAIFGYEYLRHQWSLVVNSGISRAVAEDVSKLSPECYKDFTIEPVIGGQLDIHAYLDDGRRIRLGDIGEGIQSYALSRLLFELTGPEILLWDDIESHLNPRMVAHIADWFGELVKKKKQIIISTHSIEATKLVAGVNEEYTRICLCSLKDSILKVKTLTLSETEKLQEAGVDARTAEALLL